MKALVDTCGWIEWLTEGLLVDRFAPYLEAVKELVVPTSLQFELYKWVRRERDEALALEIVALTEQATIVPLTTALALFAADLAIQRRQLSFADAIVYATARQYGVPLVTSDAHFEGLSGVEYFSE